MDFVLLEVMLREMGIMLEMIRHLGWQILMDANRELFVS